jgi:hypothetical protein
VHSGLLEILNFLDSLGLLGLIAERLKSVNTRPINFKDSLIP